MIARIGMDELQREGEWSWSRIDEVLPGRWKALHTKDTVH